MSAPGKQRIWEIDAIRGFLILCVIASHTLFFSSYMLGLFRIPPVIEYVMEDPSLFGNGRQFAAYGGFTPRHTGTGGKITVMGVDHQGCHILKRVLFQAAMALYMRVKTPASPDPEARAARRYSSKWVDDMALRKPIKKVVCAIANRMCRIAWAVGSDEDGSFDDGRTTLVRRLHQDPKGNRHSLEDDCGEFSI